MPDRIATETVVTMPAANTAEARYIELRALRVASVEAWIDYQGTPVDGDGHVVQIGAEQRRLLRGEAFWWVLGVADAYSAGTLVTALLDEEIPELMTVEEAAAAIPREDGTGHLTVNGVEHALLRGVLLALGGPRRQRRMLFAAQVHAVAAARVAHRTGRAAARAQAREAARVWRDIRLSLPPSITFDDPAADPDGVGVDLPVPTTLPEATRQSRALMLGHGLGLFEYGHPDADRSRYTVHLRNPAGRVRERALPPVGVLPWVLGVADRAGRGAAVAYRPGL